MSLRWPQQQRAGSSYCFQHFDFTTESIDYRINHTDIEERTRLMVAKSNSMQLRYAWFQSYQGQKRQFGLVCVGARNHMQGAFCFPNHSAGSDFIARSIKSAVQ